MYTIPPPPNLCPEKKSLQCKLAKEKVEWRITTAPNAAEKLDRSRANRLARAEQCEPEPWVYRFEASPPWDAAVRQAWQNDIGSSSGDQWSTTPVQPAYPPPPGFDMRAPAGPPPGSPSITPCEL